MPNILIWIPIALGVFLVGVILCALYVNFKFHQLAKDRYTQADRNKFVFRVAHALIPIIFRIKVNAKGLEHLEGSEKAVLFPNHQSLMDIPILIQGVGRPHGYVAKKELDNIFIISQGMRLIRCEFMDRQDPRQSVRSISNAAKTVKEGHMMVIFPEGTRVVRGELGLFKAGSFKVAEKSGADIFPVTIYNSPAVHKRWPRKTVVEFEIHPPLTPAVYKEMTTAQIAEQVEAAVKNPMK